MSFIHFDFTPLFQNPPSVSNPNIFNPLAPSVSKTQQPMTPPTVGNMYRSDAGAWNDPPTLRSKKVREGGSGNVKACMFCDHLFN